MMGSNLFAMISILIVVVVCTSSITTTIITTTTSSSPTTASSYPLLSIATPTTTITAPTKPTKQIGWKEKISLPSWGIDQLVSKTDTGARSSAIDCENVRVKMVNSSKVVDFDVILSRTDRKKRLRLENIPVKSETRVKSSNGHSSVRIRVSTSVKIGTEVLHDVDFTLATRTHMICPVLLGRNAIKGRFVVDSHKKFILSKKIRRRKKDKRSAPGKRSSIEQEKNDSQEETTSNKSNSDSENKKEEMKDGNSDDTSLKTRVLLRSVDNDTHDEHETEKTVHPNSIFSKAMFQRKHPARSLIDLDLPLQVVLAFLIMISIVFAFRSPNPSK